MEANYFTILWWFLPYIDMNQTRVYMCPPSWTPLPPPSPSHPSGSSLCTSPEHPVSCIEAGLAICFTYDNIHVSMLFSQIIPPSLSPTASHLSFKCCHSTLRWNKLVWARGLLKVWGFAYLLFCFCFVFMQRALKAIGKILNLQSSSSQEACCPCHPISS